MVLGDNDKPNGWNEWSKFVLNELQRLNVNYENLTSQVQRVQVQIATLKVKSGIWGVIGGSIPIMVGVLIWLLRTKL